MQIRNSPCIKGNLKPQYEYPEGFLKVSFDSEMRPKISL